MKVRAERRTAIRAARRPTGWGVVELLALVAMTMAPGCCFQHAPPPLHGVARDLDNPRTITDEDRLTAMMSVHAHAYHKIGRMPASVTPEYLDLPSLDRIVAILTADRDPFANSRRYRAVAQLAAYGGNDKRFLDAWHSLLNDDTDLIGPIVSALKLDETQLQKERRIYNLLSKSGKFGSMTIPTSTMPTSASPGSSPMTCVTKDPVYTPPVWQPTNEIDVHLEITVANTSAAVVAQRIDPQNWAHCPLKTHPFFANAYLTTDAPSPTTTCPIPNPPVPPDPANNNPKPLGSRYNATLFEDFVCPGACNAEYKNLLTIDTVVTDSSATGLPCGDGVNPCDQSSSPANPVPYEACYKLGGGGKALVGCLGSRLVHLTTDQGDLTACDDKKPDTRVVSRKGIKFRESSVNSDYAYGLLWVGQVEATQMLAEVVCCVP